MRSECYIFLINFLNAAVENVQDGVVIKKVDIESDLWLEGKNVGRLKSNFVIQHLPYLRQKLAGVMTESGHKKSAPVIMGKNSNPKVKELIALFDELKDLYDKFETVPTNQKSDSSILIKMKLESLNKLLNETDKVSSNCFIYKTMEDMVKTQELFIELGHLLSSSYEKIDTQNEKVYYACLTFLLKRGEFELSALGFDQDLSKTQIENKKRVGLKYQKLLYKLLGFVFNDLEQKGLSEYQRTFIEFFLSYSYFRVPEFRHELLSVLSDQNVTKSYVEKENKELESVLLDWGKDFYVHLVNEEKYSIYMDILSVNLKKNWREKFKKKGIIFFFFITQWVEYVVKTLVVKDFFWENIYGYEILVNTFVEQLGSRDLNKYPDVLIDASKSLLANPNVLDIMVKTLIAKTK